MVGAWARGVQLAAEIRRSGRFVTLSAGAIRGCLAATGGRTLYIYPEPYEGQECTKYVFCTGPTPAQKCDQICPYIIKTLGRKRFPAANYVAPQLDNKYAHMVIEANGGEVVFEEYYPIDQAEYSATISKIRDGTVDCVLQNHFFGETTPYKKSGC